MSKEVEVEQNAEAKSVGDAAGAGAAAGVADALQNEVNSDRMNQNVLREAGGGGMKGSDFAEKNLPGMSIGKEMGKQLGENSLPGIAKEMGKLGESVIGRPYPITDCFPDLKKYFEKDGVQTLGTGDAIVKENGKQTLFTPGGDKIVLNPDGTHEIKGDVQRVASKWGVTTVEFADGGKVSFDKQGFRSVERDGQAVHFGRRIDLPHFQPKWPQISDPIFKMRPHVELDYKSDKWDGKR